MVNGMRCVWVGCLLVAAAGAGAQQPAPSKAEAPKAETPKPAAAPKPAPPAEPREKRQANYGYDLNGRPVSSNPAVREDRKGAGAGAVVERQEALRDYHGRPVTTVATRDRVVAEQGGNRTSERSIQRFDPTGRPTSRQLVRTETRQLPDGSTVSTEVLYETDLNGRLQFAERRTTTEKKTAAGAASSTVVEQASVNGGAHVVERLDRTETKRSDSVTESASTRKLLDGNGRLAEREWETSVATKTGEVTSKETKQWQIGATGQRDFVSRSVGRLTEKPDGSEVEEVEVYTTRIAGTTPDLNRPQVPSLEQQSRREKKVQTGGKIVETTSTRQRMVAEPTRLGGLIVEDRVTTPSAQGKTIERTVSERNTNGRMVRISTSVEEEKQ